MMNQAQYEQKRARLTEKTTYYFSHFLSTLLHLIVNGVKVMLGAVVSALKMLLRVN